MRSFLCTLLSSILLTGCCSLDAASSAPYLNDVHSRLNRTRLKEIHYPRSEADVIRLVERAKREGSAISISGGRHAMGGQQFGEDTMHLSMVEMNDVLSFDKERGIIRVEPGITWPELIDYLLEAQKGDARPWTIIQKQTGADRLTIGGAVSANAHGRGVRFKPIIQDIESLTLVNAGGKRITSSRRENPELFSLVVGGYGLFGVITSVDLRLQPRQKLQRKVEIISLKELPAKAKERLEAGFLYGDFQYKTDETSDDFMQVGVLSAYKPVSDDTPVPDGQHVLTPEQWYELIRQAHVDKGKAFDAYAAHYRSTDGQIYWSDMQQMSFYADGYVDYLEKAAPDYPKGSLMITELYVPREQLEAFIGMVIDDVRQYRMNVIYGTMRLIEQDDESFLAWAKSDYACVIFNLRVEHGDEGVIKAQEDFQRLIDRALSFGGSYFLTYHRWARKDQLLAAYPQFPEFMRLKRMYDPEERFQSDWYRHYRSMLAGELQ